MIVNHLRGKIQKSEKETVNPMILNFEYKIILAKHRGKLSFLNNIGIMLIVLTTLKIMVANPSDRLKKGFQHNNINIEKENIV